jgi:hypothetical protein
MLIPKLLRAQHKQANALLLGSLAFMNSSVYSKTYSLDDIRKHTSTLLTKGMSMCTACDVISSDGLETQ